MSDDEDTREVDEGMLAESMSEFGLSDGYTRADIMASYHKLARRYHPDLAQGEEDKEMRERVMRRVNAECQVLLSSLSACTRASDARAAGQTTVSVARDDADAQRDAHDGTQYDASDDASGTQARGTAADAGAKGGFRGFASRLTHGDLDFNRFASVMVGLTIAAVIAGIAFLIAGNPGVGWTLIVLAVIDAATQSLVPFYALKLLGHVLLFVATVLDGLSLVAGGIGRACRRR